MTTTALASVAADALAPCGDDVAPTAAADRRRDRPASTSATPVIDPGDGGDYHPTLDPADFVDAIDNPYLPLAVGSRWVYEGDDRRRARSSIEVVVHRPSARR